MNPSFSVLDQARSLFETPPPAVTAGEAALVAARAYGLKGTARPLAGERDANFLIEGQAIRPCVLKFINDAEADDEAEMQAAALDHMARAKDGLCLPQLVTSRDGRRILATTTSSGRPVRTRCCSYLPGAPVQRQGIDDAMRRTVGRTAARVTRALHDFRHPAMERLNLWDLCQVGHLSPLAVHLAPSPLAEMMASFLARFQDAVVPRLSGLRRQAIHNDLSPSNMLVAPGSENGPLSVVDFGDMIAAPLLCELAVAASYQISVAQPLKDLQVVAAGFAEVQPLQAEERALLLDLVMARLAGRILIPGWRASLFPENRAYILRSKDKAEALFHALFPAWRNPGDVVRSDFFTN